MVSVPPALYELTDRPEEATLRQLWEALTSEEREAAVEAALREGEGELQTVVREGISHETTFRRSKVDEWSPARISRYADQLRPSSPTLLRKLIFSLHFADRVDLLSAFLDKLELPHEGGRLQSEEAGDHVPVPESNVHAAADELAREYPSRHVVTYFLALILLENDFAPGLDQWLQDRVERSDEVEEPAPAAGSSGEEASDRMSAPEFSTLDRQLIRTIVDVAQGIEGALTADQLEDLVDEIIQLNSKRHRSYFHAGFADVVLGREARTQLPAQNLARRRWYWAGYLVGLNRHQEWDRIAELYDQQSVIRNLADSLESAASIGPAKLAAEAVFGALRRADRPAEVGNFLSRDVVLADQALLPKLLEMGVDLLHENRASEARPLFDLLGETVLELQQRGISPQKPLFLQIRRRQAHCYRQLGRFEPARALLQTVERTAEDPDMKALAAVDIGIINSGYYSLSDLIIPDDADERQILKSNLEEGEAKFREAIDTDAEYGAHGHYCVGLLELLRGNHGSAADHLAVALSVFEGDPRRYSTGDLLDHARIYRGTADLIGLREGKWKRAVHDLRRGLGDQVRLPSSFAEEIIRKLHTFHPTWAQQAAEALVTIQPEPVLETLDELEDGYTVATESDPLTNALLDRANRSDLPDAKRCEDYRTALPLLLAQDREQEARDVLNALEEAAEKGMARPEFADLLQDPGNYQPVWTPQEADWARARCLEQAERFEEARSILEGRFHEVLQQKEHGFEEEAEGILERIRNYDLGTDLTQMEARLEELRSREKEPAETEEESTRRVRILFVGGDETQAQYDDAVREELARENPNIEVTFLHTGWESNWSNQLDEALRELPRHDGTVLMYYMRTELFKCIREEATVWRRCHRTGKAGMMASIRRTAQAARRHLQRIEREEG